MSVPQSPLWHLLQCVAVCCSVLQRVAGHLEEADKKCLYYRVCSGNHAVDAPRAVEHALGKWVVVLHRVHTCTLAAAPALHFHHLMYHVYQIHT